MRIGILDVSTIPEGYYYIGASAGRDWFIELIFLHFIIINKCL